MDGEAEGQSAGERGVNGMRRAVFLILSLAACALGCTIHLITIQGRVKTEATTKPATTRPSFIEALIEDLK